MPRVVSYRESSRTHCRSKALDFTILSARRFGIAQNRFVIARSRFFNAKDRCISLKCRFISLKRRFISLECRFISLKCRVVSLNTGLFHFMRVGVRPTSDILTSKLLRFEVFEIFKGFKSSNFEMRAPGLRFVSSNLYVGAK